MFGLRQFSLSTFPSTYEKFRCINIKLFSYSVYGRNKNPISFINSYHIFTGTHNFNAVRSYSPTSYQMFDKMSQTNQHFLTNLIFSVIDLLRNPFSKPNVATLRIVHCIAIKVGIITHLPISTCILTSYSRAGDFYSSHALFTETSNKDVIIWNAMISASVENQRSTMAAGFFLDMFKEGIGFDSTTLLIVVSALSHLRRLKLGTVIHNLSIKSGMLLDSSLCNAIMDMYSKCGDLNSSVSLFYEMESRDVVSWNTIMSGCLRNNHPDKTLLYFREMTYVGELLDNVSLSCTIAASTCYDELSHGEVIHGLVIKLGYENSSCNSVANSLISLYSQIGEIESAENLFWGMRYKDVISWNAMIDGFALNGMSEETFIFLRNMQLMGSEPDLTSLITVFPLCAELMMWNEGRSIHGYTIRRFMGYDLSLMNSLIDFYSKCSSVGKAEFLFNSIPVKDLVSWNTMISGYAQNGCLENAQHLFKEMLNCSSDFTLSTLLAILPLCTSHEYLNFGKLIHCWQLKLGFSNNTIAVNSLMYMYVNCGDLTAGLSLLKRIFPADDTSSWNTIIVSCTKNGHFQEALETFNSMRQNTNCSHDSVTLFYVISACGNLELPLNGRSLHGLSVKSLMGSDARIQNVLITMYSRCKDISSAELVFISSQDCNICSWNCMITGFSQNKAEMRALELFRDLEFRPNEITIVSILSACSQLGILRHGREIHGHVFRLGYQENSYISAALIDMYGNSGRLEISSKIFGNSRENSTAAWNSMIAAYGYHGKGRNAIELFNQMCDSGIRPTKSTFINLLSACSHSGLVNEGLWYYSVMMKEYEVKPETEHHVCIVDMLGRSGKLTEVYEFIKDMSYPPDAGVWGAMLSACNYHGDTEMGKKIAQHLFEIEPENTGYYISLSNMYAGSGRWKDAVEIRETIENRGLRKPVGYSLIEIG